MWLLHEIIATLPSLEHAATAHPNSCGAHEIAFTLPSKKPFGVTYTLENTFELVSFHIITV
tara:strand:- start:123 stop:305 length:183 start_codon:yes stop_codon:yes gene_type:complete